MTYTERLHQISLSLEKFQRTGDVEHLADIERILNEEILRNRPDCVWCICER